MVNFSDLLSRYQVNADPLRSQRRVELAVVILIALLLLQLIWGVLRIVSVGLPDAISPAADSLEVASMNVQTSVPAEARNEMRSRPLFWVSRRPLTEAVAVVEDNPEDKAKATPQELKNIKLLGVFGSTESTGIIAIVKGKKRRLLQGEEYEGWTLESVDTNEVVFSDGPRRETLILKQAVITAPPPVIEKSETAKKETTAAETQPAAQSEQQPPPGEPEPPARLGFEGR